MLFKKLLRTFGLYKTQFISMIIMISLGIGIFLGFNILWVSLEKNIGSFFEETHFADYRIYDEYGFTEGDVNKLFKKEGIESVSRTLFVQTDVKDKQKDTISLNVIENEDVSGFLLMEGEEYDKESLEDIWLSKSYANENNILVGDELTLEYQNVEIQGQVKGLIKSGEYVICVRDDAQIMPDYTTHGYAYISPMMYRKLSKFEYYPQINVITSLGKKEFTDLINDLFNKTLVIQSKDETISYVGLQREVEQGKTMGLILPVVFLFIASLTMVTTMHRLVAKEKTQIGTLRALGFKDKRIALHYTFYSFMVAIIGVILGVGIGYLIALYLLKPDGVMTIYFDIPSWKLHLPVFCVIVVIIIVLSLTLIGYLSTRKTLKGPVADTLRPYIPKNVKKIVFENSAFWDKLDFGARWNIRDSMRNKSRTFMSLIGVAGCSIIILASLGMRDTFRDFLDLNYNKSMLYDSKIVLSKDISEEKTNELIQKYNGDTSASIGVKIEEKAVSLDVYNTPNYLVQFVNQENNFEELKDNGAYLSKRIADDFNLGIGDSFSINMYGSDKTFQLKTAGIIRSFSESIVISSKYADKMNIPHKIDTIYTDKAIESIAFDESILSVQSKQAIIDTFNQLFEFMNLLIIILIVIAIILGIVVLYNLGIMSYTERYREMATLKVVGFKDKKIGQLLIGQNVGITLIGLIVGIPLGIVILNYLIVSLTSEYELVMVVGVPTYIITIVMTIGMSLFVSFILARKNKEIDMVEALKGVD